MPHTHAPDFGPHPNLNGDPLRTGVKPETLADRERASFGLPGWVVDQMSAGLMALGLAAIVLTVAILVIGLLPGLMAR